jgi:hypothetical protein
VQSTSNTPQCSRRIPRQTCHPSVKPGAVPIIPLPSLTPSSFAFRHVAAWFHIRTEKLCYQSQLFTLHRVSRIVYTKRPFSLDRQHQTRTTDAEVTPRHTVGLLTSLVSNPEAWGLAHRCWSVFDLHDFRADSLLDMSLVQPKQAHAIGRISMHAGLKAASHLVHT